MHRPMEGVRVLEIAQYAFVPTAGAVLADWGAEVVKVEHAVRGDAQRGLTHVMGVEAFQHGRNFAPSVEGPNRGKRSVGLALDNPDSQEVLRELIRRSDVLLTNYLPGARARLGIEVDQVRAINPDIIYARGSGFGTKGPEATKPGYDITTFLARGGVADGSTPSSSEFLVGQPSAAYGDSIGGLTLVGGIAAALFARERTGEPSVVDLSLIGVGAWATQMAVNLAMLNGGPLPRSYVENRALGRNPLVGNYKTSDNRWLMLSMLQPGRYWAEFWELVGHPELIADERFVSAEKIVENAADGSNLVAQAIGSRPLAEWLDVFARLSGAWSVVQNSWEVANDPSIRANGLIATVTDIDGHKEELVTTPIQFDEKPYELTRGPQFAEHTDEVLRELGFDEDRIIGLKVAGAVT